MPRDKDEYNRKRRERYEKRKAAGLSRDQQRSAKKAVQADPTLAETIGGLFSGLVREVAQALEKASDELLSNPTAKTSGKGATKGKGGGRGKGSQPSTNKRKPTKSTDGGTKGKKSKDSKPKQIGKTGGGRPPAPKPDEPRKWTKEERDRYYRVRGPESFESFAAERGHLSANKIVKEYRAAGGKISNERAKEVIRNTYRVPRQDKKSTRIKYLKASDTNWKVGGKKIKHKNYHISGYSYIVKYRAIRTGMVESETDYVTITSDTKLSAATVRDKVSEMMDELRKKKAKYKLESIEEGSIQIMYAIDNSA